VKKNNIKKFALIGIGGYIAPRHLKAIKDTGNILVAALDKNDSVGVIDQYFPDADFFTEFERFDRHLEKKRRDINEKIDYVTICSPNYLHDAHIRFALRIGANVICEKPLVINPWNIDPLYKIETETKKNINVILQLRLHPVIIELKKEVEKNKNKIFEVELSYITPRGKWYDISWKGDEKKSGGIVTNIGIHFFDILLWIFGKVKKNNVIMHEKNKIRGYLELERANIKWFLSIDKNDLFLKSHNNQIKSYRSFIVDNKEIEFSDGFTDLHTKSYEKILNNKGFGVRDVKSSIELVHDIRKQY